MHNASWSDHREWLPSRNDAVRVPSAKYLFSILPANVLPSSRKWVA